MENRKRMNQKSKPGKSKKSKVRRHRQQALAITTGSTGPLRAPSFQSIAPEMIKRRLLFSSAFANNVSVSQCFALLGGCNVTTILNVPFYWAFRVKKIEVWSSVVTIGTPVKAFLTDVSLDSAENDFNGIPATIVDEGVSIDKPAHVWLCPGSVTPLGAWHNGANNIASVLWSMQCSANSIVDVTFEVIFNLNFNSNVYTRAVVAASPGTFTCLGLSGSTVEGVTNL